MVIFLPLKAKRIEGLLHLRANNGAMMVINAVPLESYLYGVVPQEAIPSWPAAALEAQAVKRLVRMHYIRWSKIKISSMM